jgi:hypothetical protein
MAPKKKKRRSSVVEIGNGPARVRIYTMNRKDGYPEFTLSWKEGGRRKLRNFGDMDEARMIAQQTTVRLTNGGTVSDEATKRDIELLHHCEGLAKKFGATLAAAMDEWVSARSAVVGCSLSDAILFYQANRSDLRAVKTIVQVAEEFVASRAARTGGPRKCCCSSLRADSGTTTTCSAPYPTGSTPWLWCPPHVGSWRRSRRRDGATG